jgi:purine-binding chemotaxis protein CheW
MPSTWQLVVFILDDQRYALRLDAVERVVRAVRVTPLPQAPASVCGVVDVAGQIIPVLDMRRRFHLPAKEVALSDQLIIARASMRLVAFIVDAVSGVIECQQQDVVPAEAIAAQIEYVAGVVKLEDGMLFIHDLDTFLSQEEARSLAEAMGKI